MKSKAVFLDRDGTIARDVGYCSRVEDFEILSKVPEAIRLLNQHRFKVVVITNQSGIARGYFTEGTLLNIHQEMESKLEERGALIDGIYYCPHHPADNCLCRKPGTALFHKAATDLDLALQESFVVGDTKVDMEAGMSLMCKTVLITTGLTAGKDVIFRPSYTAANLLDATEWIINENKNKQRGGNHDNQR